MNRSTENSRFDIAGRAIGPGHACYIIAEISCNHEGSLEEAQQIIEVAADSGADAVKIQTYTADSLTRDFQHRAQGTMWESLDLYSLYQKAHTPWKWHLELKAKAERCGIQLFSSPFDETAVDFLVEQSVPALKIASFELVDCKLLQKAAATGLPVLMSTGMADYLEIVEAVGWLRAAGCQKLALFHCNSGYPASFDEANLRTIPVMARLFGVPVGISDHILFADPDTASRPVAQVSPVEAVRLGADMVEVHLALDRRKAQELYQKGEGGFDWAFSREPQEFRNLVHSIRTLQSTGELDYATDLERQCAARALGQATFEPTPRELRSRDLRPSLWVTKAVAQGEPLCFAAGSTQGNFDSLRPGGGLAIRFVDAIQGCRATVDLEPGTPLGWQHIDLSLRERG